MQGLSCKGLKGFARSRRKLGGLGFEAAAIDLVSKERVPDGGEMDF